jgi:hypothetical protein
MPETRMVCAYLGGNWLKLCADLLYDRCEIFLSVTRMQPLDAAEAQVFLRYWANITSYQILNLEVEL